MESTINNLTFSTLGCPELTFEEILKLANAYGLSTIEVRGILDRISIDSIDILQPENRAKTKKMLADADVSICVLGCSASFHGEHEAALREVAFASETASELDIPYIRVFGDMCKNERMLEHVVFGLNKACDIASLYGITVLLETHGEFNRADLIELLFSKLGKLNLGIIWDIEHTHRAGENAYDFAKKMLPYIKHVHMKDVSKDGELCLPGKGVLCLPDVYKHLTSLGYTGLFSLEWEKRWHNELPKIEKALDAFVYR